MSNDLVTKELRAFVQPGREIKAYFGPGLNTNRTMHIRAIVDTDHIVFRTWSDRKQEWWYHVEHIYYFALLYRDGYLS